MHIQEVNVSNTTIRIKMKYDLKDSTITQNINLIFELNACVMEIIVCVKEKVINVTHK